MSDGVLGVIPARLGSTRLPRKPLHPLAGRPLIEWVWRRAVDSSLFTDVVIATDSEEVAGVARGFGAETQLTSSAHLSGTDRVAEVARSPRFRGYSQIVNIQGDEPFVDGEQLGAAIDLLAGGWAVGTAATSIRSVDEWRDESVVKVVLGEDGGALLFSRAPIPHRRGGVPTAADLAEGQYLRHLGIYAYTADALERWVRLPAGALEKIEHLEQLRPLAAGIPIGVARVRPTWGGVDTLADARAAEMRLLDEMNSDAGAGARG